MSAARAPLAHCVRMSPLRLSRRLASTTPARPAPPIAVSSSFHAIPAQDGRVRSAFAVYPSLRRAALSETSAIEASSETTEAPETAPPPTSTLIAYDRQQIARMDPTGARSLLFSRKNPDSAKPGDVLLVTPSRAGAEAFAGVCLAIRRTGIETAILLRGQLAKTGIERWFKIYSRAVAAVDIIQRRPRRARRARLTYMRQPKHDRGAVDDLVRAWRSSRNVLRTRSSVGAAQSSKAKGKAPAAKK